MGLSFETQEQTIARLRAENEQLRASLPNPLASPPNPLASYTWGPSAPMGVIPPPFVPPGPSVVEQQRKWEEEQRLMLLGARVGLNEMRTLVPVTWEPPS